MNQTNKTYQMDLLSRLHSSNQQLLTVLLCAFTSCKVDKNSNLVMPRKTLNELKENIQKILDEWRT